MPGSDPAVVECVDIHQNGLFLPWHRAFVYFHERSLAHSARSPDFRLPVWNWELTRGRTKSLLDWYLLPAEGTNPLFNPTRVWDPDYRTAAREKEHFSRARWLLEVTSSASFLDFSGGRQSVGSVGQGSHDHVHASIGGDMGVLNTAANDPLFFLHHANIDRQWASWQEWTSRCKPDGFHDIEASLLDVKLYFYDIDVFDPAAKARLVYITPRQTLDYRSAFGYMYEPVLPRGKQTPCDGSVYKELSEDPSASGEFNVMDKGIRSLRSIRVGNIPLPTGKGQLTVRVTFRKHSGENQTVGGMIAILPLHRQADNRMGSIVLSGKGLQIPDRILSIEAKLSTEQSYRKVPHPTVYVTTIPIH